MKRIVVTSFGMLLAIAAASPNCWAAYLSVRWWRSAMVSLSLPRTIGVNVTTNS